MYICASTDKALVHRNTKTLFYILHGIQGLRKTTISVTSRTESFKIQENFVLRCKTICFNLCTESAQHSERWFCAFATTIVTAPLDPERSPLRGVQPSAIKIQFAKGPQWIHDKHGGVGWIVMMLMAMITYHDLRLDYFVFW